MLPFTCPIELGADAERVTLAHGEGGRLMRRLVRERILPRLGNPHLDALADAATLPAIDGPLAFTTDGFVVSPLVFPGGDIGRLAVFGTVNDLAVAGAVPLWLSLSLIIEEGLPIAALESALIGAADAAARVGVRVVAGDTKVVPRGAADGLFATTSGIGRLVSPAIPGPAALAPGDELIVSGPIGRHGVAILACRESLGFDPPPTSDCAPLVDAVAALRDAKLPVRAIRDATRGGVAAVLHEFAEACGHTLAIDESRLPVTGDVRGVCELLGLDPLQMACEGTMVVAVEAGFAEAAVTALRRVVESAGATAIGSVRPQVGTPVVVRRALGAEQALDEPSGAPLPRIC